MRLQAPLQPPLFVPLHHHHRRHVVHLHAWCPARAAGARGGDAAKAAAVALLAEQGRVDLTDDGATHCAENWPVSIAIQKRNINQHI